MKPNFKYANAIFSQPSKSYFSKRIESVQFNAELESTVAMKGSSSKTLNQKL